MATMPKQKPHRSKQDYETPPEFYEAVCKRFGKCLVDLAASRENTKCLYFVGLPNNSLHVDWVSKYGDKNCWLNPPYTDIESWVKKCVWYSENCRSGTIKLLVPASVGSNWFADHVYDKARIVFFGPRITFVGAEDPYPKDCMLVIYGRGLRGIELWRWRA